MVKESVIEKVRNYTNLVRSRFPVKRVVLFGSFARGTEIPDSDIDVAVVLQKEPEDILATETGLYKLRRSIDLRIEPKLIDDNYDPSGFWEDISSYGHVIYRAV